MKKTNLTLILLSILITFSCKKIEPPIDPSQANDPIYLLEGLMNGDSLKLYVNDTTVFISNAPYNMNGVEAYSSVISDLETGFELKMIVLKPELLLSETGIQQINETNTNFIVHRTICKSFDFSNGSNQEDYTKITTNGVSYSGNQIELNEYGIYDVGFNFNNINSEIYTIPVEIGFKDEELNPYFDITVQNNKIVFESENLNVTNKWVLDGNQISTNLIDSTVVTNDIHTITHHVTDSQNNTASYTTLINYYENLIWQMSPSYCSNDVIENNYGNIIIEVLHQGELYTSVYNPTNLTEEFKITNIEYVIDLNTQSIDFVKLNVNFDTELKTLNNSKTLNLTNMKGTFHIKIN
jgi:hypothetical protein